MSIKATDKFGQVIPEGDTDPQGLMCSAYQNTNGQWVMVVINYADQEKNFKIQNGAETLLGKMGEISAVVDIHRLNVCEGFGRSKE